MPTTVTPAGARGVHRQQRGDPLQRGAVADAGRHGDDRRPGQPADDAGERALHAGEHDDGVGRRDRVDVGQQAVQPGDADVVEAIGGEAVGAQGQQALVGDRAVGGAGGDDEHPARTRSSTGSRYSRHRPCCRAGPCSATIALTWSSDARVSSTGAVPCSSSSPTMRTHCSGVLPGPYTASGMPWRSAAVVVDEGVADVGERQPPQPAHDLVGVDPTGGEIVEQRPQRRFVHGDHAARPLARIRPSPGRWRQ